MSKFKLLFAAMTEDAGASIETGELAESPSDESDIIGDQDETTGDPRRADQAMGGMGSDDVGLDAGAFARGEVDLVEQMSRTTDRMDEATGRTDDPFAGYDKGTPNKSDDLNP